MMGSVYVSSPRDEMVRDYGGRPLSSSIEQFNRARQGLLPNPWTFQQPPRPSSSPTQKADKIPELIWEGIKDEVQELFTRREKWEDIEKHFRNRQPPVIATYVYLQAFGEIPYLSQCRRRQWQRQAKKWGLQRNIKSKQKEAVVQNQRQFGTSFRHEVPSHKIERYLRDKGKGCRCTKANVGAASKIQDCC